MEEDLDKRGANGIITVVITMDAGKTFSNKQEVIANTREGGLLYRIEAFKKSPTDQRPFC